MNDLKFAFRQLLKNLGFTAVAVLTLALGIGATTAIFSVVHAVLLRPLPYREPERLMTVMHGEAGPAAAADFLDWKAQHQSFESLVCAEGWMPNLTGRDKPEQLWGLHLSEGTFEMLGVPAMYGRTFTAEECLPGKGHLVVLGYDLWRRRFNADTNILGQILKLDGEAHTVIGIMPPKFRFTPYWITWAEMWAPLPLADRAQNRGLNSLRVLGRLKPGVPRAQAQADMDAICKRLAQQYPDSSNARGVRVVPLQEKAVGNVRPALLVLLGAVCFVLLIACANVANLLLARAASRQKEIAIRAALGASRWRTIRQLLTESVMLSLLGGTLGSLLAIWGVAFLKAGLGTQQRSFGFIFQRFEDIGINSTVLGFAFVVATLTGIAFGLAPALHAAHISFDDALKEGGRGTSGSARRTRLRSALVVAEVATALLLLVGAGLMMRSFLRFRGIEPGFDPKNVLTMWISVTGHSEYVGAGREVFYRELLRNVEALPGVKSASMVNHLPNGGDMWTTGFAVEATVAHPLSRGGCVYRFCYTNYFRTMGMTLLHGRDFSQADKLGAPGVVIVNERLARHRWGEEDPLGKRLTLDDPEKNPNWLTVIGVVKDARQFDWGGEPDEEIWLPWLQSEAWLTNTHPWMSYMTLVLRTTSDRMTLINPVRNVVWSSFNKDLVVGEVKTMEQVVSQAAWQQRFNMVLIGLFAVVALILVIVGIYGVMAYTVTQRTQEMGIRMALGAQMRDVLVLVLRQGMVLALIGVAIGLMGGWAVTRVLSRLLYQVKPTDPLTFAGVTLLLVLVALFACLIPARRATRVDPMTALRYE